MYLLKVLDRAIKPKSISQDNEQDYCSRFDLFIIDLFVTRIPCLLLECAVLFWRNIAIDFGQRWIRMAKSNIITNEKCSLQ